MVQLTKVNNHLKTKVMNKEYVMHIAQTIKEQLLLLTPMPIFMSWGVNEFVATIFRELPARRLEVNGRLHSG